MNKKTQRRIAPAFILGAITYGILNIPFDVNPWAGVPICCFTSTLTVEWIESLVNEKS